MILAPAALALIQEFEGLRLDAYLDPIGKLTIGYGSTRYVTLGMVITEAEAETRLAEDVKEFADAVALFVSPKLTNNQFSAAVCFAYNVKEWQHTPLFEFLRLGYIWLASRHWLLYDKADGVPMEGLERRRAAELALFQTP